MCFVDGVLQQKNTKFAHDMQWNALCCAFDLRNNTGCQPSNSFASVNYLANSTAAVAQWLMRWTFSQRTWVRIRLSLKRVVDGVRMVPLYMHEVRSFISRKCTTIKGPIQARINITHRLWIELPQFERCQGRSHGMAKATPNPSLSTDVKNVPEKNVKNRKKT